MPDSETLSTNREAAEGLIHWQTKEILLPWSISFLYIFRYAKQSRFPTQKTMMNFPFRSTEGSVNIILTWVYLTAMESLLKTPSIFRWKDCASICFHLKENIGLKNFSWNLSWLGSDTCSQWKWLPEKELLMITSAIRTQQNQYHKSLKEMLISSKLNSSYKEGFLIHYTYTHIF